MRLRLAGFGLYEAMDQIGAFLLKLFRLKAEGAAESLCRTLGGLISV